jgi:hydrogenase nickel incorporation protein HypA/HybF
MHELGLMAALRDQALAAMHQQGGCRVVAMTLRLGELAGVDASALSLAHAVVSAGTPAAAAQLHFEPVAAQWFCGACGDGFEAAAGDCTCPRCGSPSPRLQQGSELQLLAIEIA